MKSHIVKIISFVNEQSWIVFFVLAVFITLPLWQGGYLFLLDWGMNSDEVSFLEQSILLSVLNFFSSFVQFGFYQKIIIFTLLFLLGYGGFLFVKEIFFEEIKKLKLVAYIGGVFMVINPFIYGRLITGQWIVVSSVVGTLFMIIYLLRWRNSQSKVHVIIAIIWATVTVMLSQHSIFFVSLISLLFFVLFAFEKKTVESFLWFFILLFAILMLNGNVIYGYISGNSQNSNIVEQFNDEHLYIFNSIKNGNASIYINLASLHGFWNEGENRFLSTQEHVFVWKPIFFIFLSVVIVGIWFGWRKFTVQFLLLSGIISYILAMGLNGIFTPISQFLYDNIPFYIGLREPQKWIGAFLIFFVGLFAYGLHYIFLEKGIYKYRYLWGSIFIILIFFYTPTMIWGFRGQVVPSDFPQSWYSAKDKYGCNEHDENILFLPWHQYMKMDFLDKQNVVNPASGFFGDCVLQGNNMEADHIFTQHNTQKSDIIEKYIKGVRNEEEFISDMQKLSVKYIFVSKSEDFEKYFWLNDVEELQKIQDGKNLIVYSVQAVDN